MYQSDDDEAGATSATTGRGEHGHLFKMPEELNLCGKLHVPASPESNDLARNVAKIFETMPNPDMEVRTLSLTWGEIGFMCSIELKDEGCLS